MFTKTQIQTDTGKNITCFAQHRKKNQNTAKDMTHMTIQQTIDDFSSLSISLEVGLN